MPQPRIALAMTTFYESPDVLRCQQAAETVVLAREAGYETVIVDGSENPAVAEYLRQAGALVYSQFRPGMGTSRREAIEHAKRLIDLPVRWGLLRLNTIVWTEEKPFIVREVPKIIAPLLNGDAIAVIAKRSTASFSTWPSFQAESEQEANAVYNEATGRASDPMFGPVAFLIGFSSYFSQCRPEVYGVLPFASGYIQHFGMLELIAAGFRVADSEPLDVTYPPAQKAEEETALVGEMREKRRHQMEELSASYPIAVRALGLRQ